LAVPGRLRRLPRPVVGAFRDSRHLAADRGALPFDRRGGRLLRRPLETFQVGRPGNAAARQ
jgi:hypothetical protein